MSKKKKDELKAYSLSSNDDVTLEVVALSDGIVKSQLPPLGILDIVGCELSLPRLRPVSVLVTVVLGLDEDAGLGGAEVRDDVSPPLVVVHTQGDDEPLAIAGFEAKGPGSTAATHGENVFVVHFGPGAAVGIVPASLLDEFEEGIGVGLIDADGNVVTHSVEFQVMSVYSSRIEVLVQQTW